MNRSAFLAKLIGLYCLLVGLFMLARKDTMLTAVTELVHDPPAVLILGMALLTIGLAIVLAHNVWSGGLAPVLVTVIGWLTLLKGFVLLFLSPDGLVAYMQAIHYEQLFYVFAAIVLVIGVYLTWAGFKLAEQP